MDFKKFILYSSLVASLLSCGKKESPVSSPENRNPIIENIEASSLSINSGDSIVLRCDAEDPDDDSLSYRWLSGSGRFDDRDSEQTVWHSPSDLRSNLESLILVEVSDGRDGIARDDIFVTVNAINRPPIIRQIIVPSLEVFTSDSINLDCVVEDLDNDPLVYDWRCDKGYFYSTNQKATTWYSSEDVGIAHITLGVNDNRGGVDDERVDLTVSSRFDTLLVADDVIVDNYFLYSDTNFQADNLNNILSIFSQNHSLEYSYLMFQIPDKQIRSARFRFTLIENIMSTYNFIAYMQKSLESWDVNDITWNNQPSCDITPFQASFMPIPEEEPITFYIEGNGITNMVREWQNGFNYGFRVITPDFQDVSYRWLYSRDGARKINMEREYSPALILEYE